MSSPWKCCGCGFEVPDLVKRCACVTGVAYRSTATDRTQAEVVAALRQAAELARAEEADAPLEASPRQVVQPIRDEN